MADDSITFWEEGEEAVDLNCDTSEKFSFPQTLVTEKIIFVFDMLLLVNGGHDEIRLNNFLALFKLYYNLKKKICAKPPEFECLLYSNKTVLTTQINDVKDFDDTFKKFLNTSVSEPESEESEPLKLDIVFDAIADLVELPDPNSTVKNLPPNWVYHVVWLFGRNLYVPSIENTNSLHYLMMTPYFALDILYLYNRSLESDLCEDIAKALYSLNKNGQGYILAKTISSKKSLLHFAQFLGHPLIRVPQKQARFNILKLGPQLENVNTNSNEDLEVKE